MTAPDTAALALLREMEWSGWEYVGDGRILQCCPTCRNFQYRHDYRGRRVGGTGHAPDCRLAAVFSSASSRDDHVGDANDMIAAPQPGRFGNHPDASTDFCIEIEKLEGWAEDVKAGVRSQWPFWSRLSQLLAFARSPACDALDSIAQKARPVVFELEGRLGSPEPTWFCEHCGEDKKRFVSICRCGALRSAALTPAPRTGEPTL